MHFAWISKEHARERNKRIHERILDFCYIKCHNHLLQFSGYLRNPKTSILFYKMPDPLPENRRKPTELPTECYGHNSISKSVGIYQRMYPSVYTDGNISSVYTDRFSDGMVTSADFIDEMTEGFKLRYPYSDVALSPMESLTEVIRQ